MTGDDGARSPLHAAKAGERRRCRASRGRQVGLAHVPPRVAPADPGDRTAHRRGRGRDRQRHDRVQLGLRGRCRVRLGQSSAPLRRRRSEPARGGSRRHPGTVRDDRRHRPSLAGRPRQRRPGRVPLPGPARTLRGHTACAPSEAATRQARARSPSPTAWPRSSDSRSGTHWRSTAVAGPSSASVENPRDLSDEFALVSPSSAGAPDQVTVLVDADADAVDAFMDGPADSARFGFAGSEARPNDQSANALAMFSVATVFLLLATLVAAAGFAVIAQRRLRQLGALAAIGATEKHLRLVLLTDGAVVGAIGALIGAIVGLAIWLALVPTLEPAVGHRIDPLSLPWTLLAAIVFVAVLGATAAAWWPGRVVARIPVTLALSARPPRPRATHHSTIVAARVDRRGNRRPCGLQAEAATRSSSPGSWRRSSAPCSWVHWRSASSPALRGTPRSLRAWRCETLPAIRPAPGPHSPPSPSPSGSQRRS